MPGSSDVCRHIPGLRELDKFTADRRESSKHIYFETMHCGDHITLVPYTLLRMAAG